LEQVVTDEKGWKARVLPPKPRTAKAIKLFAPRTLLRRRKPLVFE
jgi:hypothetical protein